MALGSEVNYATDIVFAHNLRYKSEVADVALYKGVVGVVFYITQVSEIAKQSGNNGYKITPCTTADYPTKAQRPRYSVLDKSKAKATFGFTISQWQESLAKCIKKF